MKLIDEIEAMRASARVKLVQVVNAAATSLLASVLIIHQVYPNVIADTIGKLPPLLGIPALLGFGVLVHYALKPATKAQ